MDVDAALDRLSEIELELASKRRQLNRLATQHHDGRIRGFFVQADTVKEREFVGEYQVLDLYREKTEAAVEVRILEDERDHIRFLLTHGT